MSTEELVRKCLDVCEDRKAVDVAGYDVRGLTPLADYYIFCSGNSGAQIRAIVQHLVRAMKDTDHEVVVEGVPDSHWVLLDCSDILIHVFHPEKRDYYNIEALLDGAVKIQPGD